MKAKLMSSKGTSKGTVNLPSQFNEEVRPDIIKRAVLAIQSHKRQPYGTDPEAGKKYSSKLSRRRRDFKGAYGIGISRVPRKTLNYRGSRFNWEGATAPNTRGGRQAHPPKAEKKFSKKINKKERHKAIRSAMSASVLKDEVSKRGHLVEEYPIILEKSAESIKKAGDVKNLLTKIGLKKELERAENKRLKTGRARRRGRKYKKATGPLLVVSEKCDLMKAASNLPGVDVVEVKSLNAELLAPGTDYGRLTIYTESAIEILAKEKLFTSRRRKPKKADQSKKKDTVKTRKKKTSKKKKKKSVKKKPQKEKKEVPLTEVKGVGPKTAKEMKKAGIETAQELAKTDAEKLAEKTSSSEEQAEKLIKRAKKVEKK